MNEAEYVRAIVAAAGLTPREDQIERMISVYPGVREQVKVLYECDAARYEDPVYEPAPVFADWWLAQESTGNA